MRNYSGYSGCLILIIEIVNKIIIKLPMTKFQLIKISKNTTITNENTKNISRII